MKSTNILNKKIALQLQCNGKPISKKDMNKIVNHYNSIKLNDEAGMHRFVKLLSTHTQPGNSFGTIANFISQKDLEAFLKEM